MTTNIDDKIIFSGHEDLFQYSIRWPSSEDSWKHALRTDRRAML